MSNLCIKIHTYHKVILILLSTKRRFPELSTKGATAIGWDF